jgi:mono/diheme cytochrome c family protein
MSPSRLAWMRTLVSHAVAWAWFWPWLGLGALAGCDIDFNRMYEQARYDEYEPSEYFSNGSIMRQPPLGTVPRSQPLGSPDLPEIMDGLRAGAPVARVPVPVTADVVRRGKNRYEIFCAPCHGLTGAARTQVSENMLLRPPPALVLPPVRTYPAGRIFRAVSYGYGLMRAYDAELGLADRWAVVAYVQALQLSQAIALEALPPAMQREARPWLP